MGHVAKARSVKLLFSRPNGPKESEPRGRAAFVVAPSSSRPTLLSKSMPMAPVNGQRKARKGPSKSLSQVWAAVSDGSAANAVTCGPRVVNGRLVAGSEVA